LLFLRAVVETSNFKPSSLKRNLFLKLKNMQKFGVFSLAFSDKSVILENQL